KTKGRFCWRFIGNLYCARSDKDKPANTLNSIAIPSNQRKSIQESHSALFFIEVFSGSLAAYSA
ncbi:hypothetical protein EAY27_29305, partial [Vibrio anguillarum]|uniref:hypothetical protein n=1 Tax=Vibrio anguillarum TaxID=55601 RepID=UPI001BE4030A